MTSPQSTSHEPSAFGMSIYLPEETEVLRRTGVLLVTLEYRGQHGERHMGALTLHDGQGFSPEVPDPVCEQIRVFLHELLEARFPGWQTGEGALGGFEWLVEPDTLEHRHELRVYPGLAACMANG